ncbi:MAG: threonine/serine exporter family protein [Candidatus Ancillula sp.]|jgi:uncharacterized membrane protein YjjP (DUF1212 family)|nr:threonine/serine exporter family protein [Candidatus Ancillula sp.]
MTITNNQQSPEVCLHEQAEVVMRAGLMSLSTGMGSYRVKSVMRIIANALGISNKALVTLTEINSTCHVKKGDGHLFNSEVNTISSVGVDSNKIRLIGNLTKGLKEKKYNHTIDCISTELTKIQNSKPLWNIWFSALWAAVACVGFTFCIGGTIFEMFGAFVGSFLGHLSRKIMLKRKYNQFIVNSLAVCVAEIFYVLLWVSFSHIPILINCFQMNSGEQLSGFVGALLFVIPGFPLITGGLDIAKMDFSAGIQRLVYAIAIILCATTIGASFAILIGLKITDLTTPFSGNYVLFTFFRFLMSGLGVFGFSLMFNSNMKTALWAGLIGGFANMGRLILIDFKMSYFLATILATLFVGLAATVIVKFFDFTRITLSVPGVLIMIPGSWLFRMSYDLLNQNAVSALNYGSKAFATILAMVVGLVIARFLTDKNWRHDYTL